MQKAEQILQAIKVLESRMMRKYQVRFGGGSVEKCLQR